MIPIDDGLFPPLCIEFTDMRLEWQGNVSFQAGDVIGFNINGLRLSPMINGVIIEAGHRRAILYYQEGSTHE